MDLGKIMEVFKERFKEVEKELSKPEVASDPEKLMEYGKKHSELSEIIDLYGEISSMKSELEEWHEMKASADESELEEIDKAISDLESNISRQELNLKGLLVPDLSDERNIIIEIRAGTGGEEAALFAADLFRMYNRYAERNNWKSEIIDSNETDIGGLKEMIFQIRGRSVFSKLKYESGVHRVQRVPSTESGGRIHTSTATVAVLPEASETEVKIDPADLRIDTYRASGAGGQHVNKTDSAVRIVHEPTGIVVAVQKGRSQHQNKARALEILRARLYEMYSSKAENEITETRRTQIGTGERSEKIRTYNYPQNRVTDHRINFTSYRLLYIMDGDLDELVTELSAADINKRLELLHKKLIG
ncbi:peptide chain release factor 1 [Mesotoga sp.]|jgi:peptide chain release factor 1|uniref:Peptide chain release factor 1 n=1 Tax=Mesotoga infera TaxID=1236046 RepID=A0A124G1B8_9BACT|nr:MAG: Peptide chain release factor 1 [Mesotoga infera]KUK90190.1 MAG: Peptide chain release factor 1 [Mesotoga infera]HCO69846.1 peptide chain release factor 1 [Mesotoga infera]